MKKYLVINKSDGNDTIIVCNTKEEAERWIETLKTLLAVQLEIKEAIVSISFIR